MLTPRELEVLKLLSEGLTTDEISLKLFISSSTVNSHRYRIQKKLKVKNSCEMICVAMRMGLI
ncbi:MAG: response regulator transcription factor [Bacteroidales bacterium]